MSRLSGGNSTDACMMQYLQKVGSFLSSEKEISSRKAEALGPMGLRA